MSLSWLDVTNRYRLWVSILTIFCWHCFPFGCTTWLQLQHQTRDQDLLTKFTLLDYLAKFDMTSGNLPGGPRNSTFCTPTSWPKSLLIPLHPFTSIHQPCLRITLFQLPEHVGHFGILLTLFPLFSILFPIYFLIIGFCLIQDVLSVFILFHAALLQCYYAWKT